MYLPCNQWYCLTKLLVLFGNYTCQKTTVTALKYGQGEKKHSKPRLISSVCKTVGCYFIISMCISAVNN